MADTINTAFQVPVSLANANPVDVMQQDPPGGPYEVEILESRQVTKEGEGGKTTLRFSVGITDDGDARGIQTALVVGTDWSKAFNLGHLANLLYGLHTPEGKFVDPAKIVQVKLLKAEMFKGQRAYIYVKEAPEGELDDSGRAARANKNFITKDQYDQAKKAKTIVRQAPKAAAKTNGTAAVTAPPPAASAGADAELASLFG